uniref:USP domain-containing protein n=1 Tax=Junco hyemalis TaxID=40217 RepID=A0A8C5NRV8_JUNHY
STQAVSEEVYLVFLIQVQLEADLKGRENSLEMNPKSLGDLLHRSHGHIAVPGKNGKETTSSASGMALPQRILFPPQEICMDWQQRQRPGAGLCNLGSTCYINVILQCLTYTPPLANYLLSRDHSQLCHQQGFCMMCIMEAHVRKVLRSSANVIWPRAVVRDLKFIGEEFEPDMAGDAYEFLRCALEAMQRACLSGSSE